MDLSLPISQAGKLFKMQASKLEKLHIYTLSDLLYHIPFRYDDYSRIVPIRSLYTGTTVTIHATVDDIKTLYTKNFKKIQEAIVSDATGSIKAVWFNQMFLTKVIKKGDLISLSGKVEFFGKEKVILSPDFEIVSDFTKTIHTGRLVGIYPETKGLTSKWLRRQIYKLLTEEISSIQEFLPKTILEKQHLVPLSTALSHIHFPNSQEEAEQAKKRLSFDELFLLHLANLVRKKEWETKKTTTPFTITPYEKDIQSFFDQLPFTLTQAQRTVIHEIFADLSTTKPMNRLLQGDVGSGKTVVAAIAMYLGFLNGFQSALLAPTEVLATQHYQTISQLLSPLGLSIGLATGSKKQFDLKKTDIMVGTHALLSQTITFERLGLVVIDEQHRFGVEQRSTIRDKGKNPHLLTMTATPIPRTIALTLYGDLQLSVINEMPIGRKSIKTWLVPEEKRNSGYEWIKDQLQKGDQAFIICPFIEESESMTTIKAAKKEFERLQQEIFPSYSLGLLHGKQSAKEKEKVLSDFKAKHTMLLVATPVVEVGIDIPNATIIVIEAAERFGLSALHQLRGRVGRGDKQSYCLLFSDATNPQTIQRLKAMEHSHSGAELAELDLKLRGPGDIFGTAQHGSQMLKIAQFSDFALIETTKKEAEDIQNDLKIYPLLQEKLLQNQKQNIAPD